MMLIVENEPLEKVKQKIILFCKLETAKNINIFVL